MRVSGSIQVNPLEMRVSGLTTMDMLLIDLDQPVRSDRAILLKHNVHVLVGEDPEAPLGPLKLALPSPVPVCSLSKPTRLFVPPSPSDFN
jgi:hypothetical protein